MGRVEVTLSEQVERLLRPEESKKKFYNSSSKIADKMRTTYLISSRKTSSNVKNLELKEIVLKMSAINYYLKIA